MAKTCIFFWKHRNFEGCHVQHLQGCPHKKINHVQTEKNRDFVIFNDFNRNLTEKFSNRDFLKVNLENLGLTRFELVKIVRF